MNFISEFFSDHAIAPKIILSQHVAHEFDVEILQPFIVSTDTTPNIMTLRLGFATVLVKRTILDANNNNIFLQACDGLVVGIDYQVDIFIPKFLYFSQRHRKKLVPL